MKKLVLCSLKRDRDFRRLRKGKFGSVKYLSIRWLTHQHKLFSVSAMETIIYVGIIVNKKVGKAVVRNLVRRRLREALKAILTKTTQKECIDIVIIAKPEAAKADFWQLKGALHLALEKAKLL